MEEDKLACELPNEPQESSETSLWRYISLKLVDVRSGTFSKTYGSNFELIKKSPNTREDWTGKAVRSGDFPVGHYRQGLLHQRTGIAVLSKCTLGEPVGKHLVRERFFSTAKRQNIDPQVASNQAGVVFTELRSNSETNGVYDSVAECCNNTR